MKHPYYSEYSHLQKLYLQILHHKKLKYGQKNDKVYGLLFDGAWLWEEYLHTILSPQGFIHPQNKTGKNGIYLFKTPPHCCRYPDFYNDNIVLDAKYKHLDEREPDRDDMHQIISYMYVRQARTGVFLFPTKKAAQTDSQRQLCGYGGQIRSIALSIPQNNENFGNFINKMQASEIKFINRIKQTDNHPYPQQNPTNP